MKSRFIKRADKAGAGNIKQGNSEVAILGRVFNRGIGQKYMYEKIENELTVSQIKKSVYEIGCKLYDDLFALEEMLEVGKKLTFGELTEIFNMIDSKEKLVNRFEQFEEYMRTNIKDIKTERDIKRIKRMFKLG